MVAEAAVPARRSGWSLWRWWVLANAGGGLVGATVSLLLSLRFFFVNIFFGVTVLGGIFWAVLGGAQWLVLRRYFPPRLDAGAFWGLASSIGGACAPLVASVMVFCSTRLTLESAATVDGLNIAGILVSLLVGPAAGVIVGGAQALAPRTMLPCSRGCWVLANGIGLGAGLLLAFLVAQPVLSAPTYSLFDVLRGPIGIVPVAVTIMSALTGLALVNGIRGEMVDKALMSTGADASLILPDWLTRQAQRGPDHPAVIIPPFDTYTWANLQEMAAGAAARLAALGVAPGDRVALFLPNGLDFVILLHAAMRLGAILVPLNTRLAHREVAWQLADARPRLLVHAGEHTTLARAATADLPDIQRVTVSSRAIDADTPYLWRRETVPAPPRERIDLAAVQSIIYTSGTTGQPKGAQITCGNWWWSALGSALNLGHRPDDCWLAVLPLFHVGGMSILMRSVIYGIPVMVHERFDPAGVNTAIDEEGVTHISVVSTMLGRMLEARGDRPYPDTLRCVLVGGGPVPRPLLERAAALGVPVVQTYGLTEATSQVATLAPADALRKLGSAGQPLLPTELRIERDGQPVGPDTPGEIVVRGPTVTPGYWGRPDATAQAIRDGWLHTGDLGLLDAEGYLTVLDRRDDLIISGGENVYPAEVEAVLLAHPGVAEVGVVGAPDAQWGQVVVAVVRPPPGESPTADDLITFCRDRLARYKVPARIVFTPEGLPRNAAGKLLRRALRDSRHP